MRQNADHFVRRLGDHQRAAVHEYVAAVHDEGVEGVVVDDADGHLLRTQARRLEDRLRIVVQQDFDLGVAQQARPHLLGRRRRDRSCEQKRDGSKRRATPDISANFDFANHRSTSETVASKAVEEDANVAPDVVA